ncbi:GTPase Era, mitochondrial-like [Pollicipes pollicipes]|uniref:GTPase Era, mitochondrial-like n=1 Tax=Pollicipes pollicipes TaxID=41117 RepID=UPI0018851F43|nr:GTPase Era, mitochondrial-like [Pollicipes pollicipes]
MLGIPNSGKSTLVNRLLSWPVCSVSSKVHTTQTCSRASLTVGDTQLVLEDTPGLVTEAERRRHRLDPSLPSEPAAALRRAGLVCVLHDVSDPRNRAGLSPKVQRLLFADPRRPAVLVLTKVDTLARKRRLLELTSQLTEGCVDGVQLERRAQGPAPRWMDAEQLLGRAAPPEPEPEPHRLEQFAAEGVQFTAGFLDRSGPPPPLAADAVRASLLEHLRDEVPYGLVCQVTQWECGLADALAVEVRVQCAKVRHSRLVLRRIRAIARDAEQRMRDAFRTELTLRLRVYPTPPGWGRGRD